MRTAAPPIATPAIPPALSFSELDAAGTGVAVFVPEEGFALAVAVAVTVAVPVTVVGLLFGLPFAVRFV